MVDVAGLLSLLCKQREASATRDELRQLTEEEGEGFQDEQELDAATAAEVVKNLTEAGYKLRPTRSKASYRQSSVESSIKGFKQVLKASFLPGLPGMSAISFTRVVQLSVATMNPRPIILLPQDASKTGELNCVSPQALGGPDHSEWSSMGKARHYAGHLSIIAQQQESFKRCFKVHYTRRLRKTHNMAVHRAGFSVGDAVMILDLSASDRQPLLVQLEIIHKFMDPQQAQAVIHYGRKNGCVKVVNRPLSLISKLKSATYKIPTQGILYDPWILEDLR